MLKNKHQRSKPNNKLKNQKLSKLSQLNKKYNQLQKLMKVETLKENRPESQSQDLSKE
jgi:hypothetical protein